MNSRVIALAGLIIDIYRPGPRETVRKPMILPWISTRSELAALPRGTVIRSSARTIIEVYTDGLGVLFGAVATPRWDDLQLPITVLCEPIREGGNE